MATPYVVIDSTNVNSTANNYTLTVNFTTSGPNRLALFSFAAYGAIGNYNYIITTSTGLTILNGVGGFNFYAYGFQCPAAGNYSVTFSGYLNGHNPLHMNIVGKVDTVCFNDTSYGIPQVDSAPTTFDFADYGALSGVNPVVSFTSRGNTYAPYNYWSVAQLYLFNVSSFSRSAYDISVNDAGFTNTNSITEGVLANPGYESFINGGLQSTPVTVESTFNVDFSGEYDPLYPSYASTLGISLGLPTVAPSDLIVTGDCGGSILLSWVVGGPAITSQTVQRSTNGVSYSNLATLSATATTYTDTTPTRGVLYYYRISATDGVSVYYSNVVTATAVLAPVAVTALSVAISMGVATLTWTGSAADTYFNVYRGLTSGGETGPINGSVITVDTYVDTGPLVPGTTYYWKVVAYNSCGEASSGTETSGTIGSGPYPPPTGLVATPQCSAILLTWTLAIGATSQEVQRSPDGSTWATIATLGASVNTYTDAPPTGATYYYQIIAIDVGGSSVSNTSSAAQTPDPVAPANVSVLVSGLTAQISWVLSAGASYYNIFRRPFFEGFPATPINTAPITAKSYIDYGPLAMGVNYFWQVVAYGVCGNAVAANPVEEQPTCCDGSWVEVEKSCVPFSAVGVLSNKFSSLANPSTVYARISKCGSVVVGPIGTDPTSLGDGDPLQNG